jgi:hypothetical protein
MCAPSVGVGAGVGVGVILGVVVEFEGHLAVRTSVLEHYRPVVRLFDGMLVTLACQDHAVTKGLVGLVMTDGCATMGAVSREQAGETHGFWLKSLV